MMVSAEPKEFFFAGNEDGSKTESDFIEERETTPGDENNDTCPRTCKSPEHKEVRRNDGYISIRRRSLITKRSVLAEGDKADVSHNLDKNRGEDTETEITA